jgi:hypothetical protein
LQIGGHYIKTKIARQIRILHANTAFEAHQWTMFKRVFAHNLDHQKNWCAYNKSLLNKTFKCFPSEVKLVKREDARDSRDDEGRQVSHRHFFAGVKTLTQQMLCSRRWGKVRHSNQYYQNNVGSRFGGLLLNLLSLSSQCANAKASANFCLHYLKTNRPFPF